MSPTEGPIVTALVLLSAAAVLFALRSFQLLFRDIRPKYRGRHRHPLRPRRENGMERSERAEVQPAEH